MEKVKVIGYKQFSSSLALDLTSSRGTLTIYMLDQQKVKDFFSLNDFQDLIGQECFWADEHLKIVLESLDGQSKITL
jgi:hypothetical protein